MSKDSRFKYTYRKNASKLHKTVGELLRTDKNFKHLTSYQEYPVNKVNPQYLKGSHKFDWVLPHMKIVIECHGRQHYEVVTFGGNVVDSIDSFHDGQARDRAKKTAALEAGWRYIEISYKEQKSVTARLIFDKLKEADLELTTYSLEHDEVFTAHDVAKEEYKVKAQELRKAQLMSEKHKTMLKRAKEERRKQYERLKKFKDGLK